MKKRWVFWSVLLWSGLAWSQVIDNTPTRVQTTLDPQMTQVGTLTPKSVEEISTSRWTLGCETIDREYSDYQAWKEYLPPLGIQRIRLQAGWARCEKDPGIYDFGWLDGIINDAYARGLTVWLETSYGNPAYEGGGGRTLAGGMPTSEVGLKAWDKWVETMARRYRDKVKDWCVWNEPELFGANNVVKIADFNIRTAEIIRREIPDARIAALAICSPNKKIIEPFLQELEKRGKRDLFQWIVYHHYTANPDDPYARVDEVREIVKRYNPNLRLWQGESGTQSEWCLNGALCKTPWTELTQAKWDARRMLGDISHGADSEVFTAADLDYRTTSFHNGLVRYGLLKTAGQAENFRVLKVKLAYYAVQNIVSVFNDSVEWVEDFACDVTCDKPVAAYGHKDVKTGVPILVFWEKSGRPTDQNETVQATFTWKNPNWKEPVWVDTLTGNAYAIPADRMVVEGENLKLTVPVYDAPVFVTEKSLLTLQESEFVKYQKTKK
ncbi:MAG: beta-galactosidase [Planctomycetia bacterium]|nr:beta-galactosidase [Planctomycetia bacterium]